MKEQTKSMLKIAGGALALGAAATIAKNARLVYLATLHRKNKESTSTRSLYNDTQDIFRRQ